MRLFLIILFSSLHVLCLNSSVTALSSARIYASAQQKFESINVEARRFFAASCAEPCSSRKISCDPVQVRLAILAYIMNSHPQSSALSQSQRADIANKWADQWSFFQDDVINYLIEIIIEMQVRLRTFAKSVSAVREKDFAKTLLLAYSRVYDWIVPENILDTPQQLRRQDFMRTNKHHERTYVYSGVLRYTLFRDFLLSAELSPAAIADITTTRYQALWQNHNPYLFDQTVKAENFPLLHQFITQVCGELDSSVKVKIRFSPFTRAIMPIVRQIENDQPVIIIDALLMAYLTEDEIKALIMHEIGHVVLGHRASIQGCSVSSGESQQQELAADEFACERLGKKASVLGEALTKSVALSLLGGEALGEDSVLSQSHPALAARIACIDEFVRTLQ